MSGSLIELLISLLLSSMLLTSLYQIYVKTKYQYQKIEYRISRYLEEQWVSVSLADSIKSAGFTPCLPIAQLTLVDRRDNSRGKPNFVIAKPHLSGITLYHMSARFAPVQAKLGSKSLEIPSYLAIKKKHPLMIADCHHAEIQMPLTAGIGSRIILQHPLLFAYEEPAYVGEWLEEKWFIQTNPQGIPALYYQEGAKKEEVSDKLHALQISQLTIKGRPLLKLYFNKEEKEAFELEVAVRGAS